MIYVSLRAITRNITLYNTTLNNFLQKFYSINGNYFMYYQRHKINDIIFSDFMSVTFNNSEDFCQRFGDI